MITIDPIEEARKRRIAILQIQNNRRHMHSVRCSLQAIAVKARLITAGKGANGRSMSPALLERHMNLR